MNIDELYQFTTWVEREIVKETIHKKYNALQAKLQHNSQPNQQRQPFDEEKENLINSLSKLPLYQLTKEQMQLLETLNMSSYLGEHGISYIEDTLVNDALDIATAHKKIQEAYNAITAGIDRSNKIRTSLIDVVHETEQVGEDEVILRVTFTGDAAMNSMADLKKWGADWSDIARGIAMAVGEAPESIKITGASKGSIILDAVAVSAVAKIFSKIILDGLKITDKIMDIRKKAAEIEGLKLSNKKIAAELKKEAESEKEKAIETIALSITQELNYKKGSDGEKETALRKSITKIVNFLEKGGDIDLIPPEIPEPEYDDEGEEIEIPKQLAKQRKSMAELSSTIEEIRMIEAKHRQIEHSKNDENNE